MKIKWNEEKIEYLKNNYSVKSAEDLAKELNTTTSSIFQKAFKLKLKGRPNGSWSEGKSKTLSDEEQQYIKNNYTTLGPKILAENLNKNWHTVHGRI